MTSCCAPECHNVCEGGIQLVVDVRKQFNIT